MSEFKKLRDIPETGKVVYQFESRITGKRIRSRFQIYPAEVKRSFREWERGLVEKAKEVKSPKLFEMLEEYLLYVKQMKSQKMHAHEIRAVQRFKAYFSPKTSLHEIIPASIEDYALWRKCSPARKGVSELSIASVNRDIATLSTFFNWAIDRRYYQQVNPCYRKKLRGEGRRKLRLTREQREELLNTTDGEIRTAVMFALYAGLRLGEILTLSWGCVHIDQHIIVLTPEVTKNGKGRDVVMPQILVDYLKQCNHDNPRVVMLTPNQFRTQWNNMRKRLSFKNLDNGLSLRFHDLRHVYGQRLRDGGLEMSDIRDLLGHSSVAVTEQYYVQYSREVSDRVDVIFEEDMTVCIHKSAVN